MNHPHAVQAIGLTVVAGFTLAAMDGIGKLMMADYHPTQIVWARYFFHTLFVGAVYAAQDGWRFILPRHPALQVLRGFLLLLVTVGMYFAIRTVSLADATAIMFFAPVLVTVLAGAVLHEPVRMLHLVSVGAGFLGVLFIVRPGFAALDPMLLLPCMSSLALAGYLVMTRYLRGHDAAHTTLFHTTATGSIAMTGIVLPWWQSPDAVGWLVLCAIGALGAAGHFMLIRAFRLETASVLSPFLYAQLLAAALYSMWWFGETLQWHFWAGAGLIAGAGILVGSRPAAGGR